MSRVTILTASTGRPSLARCIDSVANQTHKDIQHLVFLDGPDAVKKMCETISYDKIAGRDKYDLYKNVDVIELPYSTGKDRWNGHRMYGAGTFLADDKSEFLMFLDDDNTIDPNHVESLLAEFAKPSPPAWAYSLRKIVDQKGEFLCNDDCESLGRYHTVLSQTDHLVDVNCYFLSKQLAVQLTPLWYRKAREPGVMQVDRALIATLLHNNIPGASTGRYTVNYTVGGNALSVAPEFFIKGNAKMAEIYGGEFPWRKK